MMVVNATDFDAAYRAVRTRDPRFDGQFVTAVHTTGVYCRPSCPAKTPLAKNVTFYASSAGAQAAGYRACKRCGPQAVPGSPMWNRRADTVGAAVRLISDGFIDRHGVPALAGRLGYSQRQLSRLLKLEVGASPLSLARAQRAETARLLLRTSQMPASDVAFAAGFSSIRQFNDTVRDVFGVSPSALRSGSHPNAASPGSIALQLPVRGPFDVHHLIASFAAQTISCVEYISERSYVRSLRLPRGIAIAKLTLPADLAQAATGAADVELTLTDMRDLSPAVERCRRIIDADADPVGIDDALRTDRALTAHVDTHPGMRIPGSPDPTEAVLRALIHASERHIRPKMASLVKIVEDVGDQLPADMSCLYGSSITHLPPTPAQLAAVKPDTLPLPGDQAVTLIKIMTDLADGNLVLDSGTHDDDFTASFTAYPTVRHLSIEQLRLHLFNNPDILTATDPAIRRGAQRLGLPSAAGALNKHAARWQPFRSYAGLHLGAAGRES